jgi:putative glutamine amidotransferase
MRRPIIGITTYGRDEDNRFRLPSLYVDAVRRAGGIAVLLPPGDDPWDELFDVIDGLILAGGGDVDPSLYGGHPHETIYGVDAERDHSELALARRVAASEVPTLGICRGHQLINVALGGTLHEHLPDVVGGAVVHRLPPREATEHPISVDSRSRLAAVLGEQQFVAASWHHQAIRDAAKGLVPVARAPDGTIEGCELKSHPWLFTVQWHPELTAHASATQQRLFDSLVEACRRKIEAECSAVSQP